MVNGSWLVSTRELNVVPSGGPEKHHQSMETLSRWTDTRSLQDIALGTVMLVLGPEAYWNFFRRCPYGGCRDRHGITNTTTAKLSPVILLDRSWILNYGQLSS
jgi:hypothetical protein